MVRTRYIVAVSVLLALLTVGTLALLRSREPYAVRLHQSIRPGMALHEVQTLVGVAAVGTFSQSTWGHSDIWVVDGYCLIVRFDERDRVFSTNLEPPNPEPNLLDRLRLWLGI